MAKQLVNPVERHVEKAVLAIAGLLLIGVIARYLVTSPNQLTLGGQPVSAPQIDERMADKAKAIRESIMRAAVPAEMPEPQYDQFLELLDPFKRAKLPMKASARVALGPEVPLIDPAQSGEGKADLAKAVAPEKPAATTGRSTFLVKDATGSVRHAVSNWVTVSALIDVKQQMVEQEKEYRAHRKNVIFGLAELQRRAQRDNGSWHDDDWVTVQPWALGSSPLPPAPDVVLVEDEDSVKVAEDSVSSLGKLYDLVSEPKKQRDVIRPKLPDIVNGSEWTFPVITSYLDVLRQDDLYLNPTSPPAADPVDIYKKAEEKTATPQPEPDPKPGSRVAEQLQEIDRMIENALKTLNENEAIRAYNRAFELEKDKGTSASEKSKAKALKEKANQTEKDIRRKKLGPGPGGPPKPPQPEGTDSTKREPLPVQQIWVHDAEPGSVQSGRTYQYRLRPVIYNRQAGQPEKFLDPTNAQIVWIKGPWTEPIEVNIEPSTLFFVTLEKPANATVSAEFFQWFAGVWVKTRQDFGVGQPLSVQTRCDVPALDNPKVADRALVDFKADATVVDIDYGRSYRERKRGTGRAGVKFGPSAVGCSVVFADAAGRLQERFVPTDKGHPDKAAAGSRVWVKPRG